MLLATLSATASCVTMWPNSRKNSCADERSLLTLQLVQRLRADQLSIGYNAFANMENLRYVNLPESLKMIDHYAFLFSHDVEMHYTNDTYAHEWFNSMPDSPYPSTAWAGETSTEIRFNIAADPVSRLTGCHFAARGAAWFLHLKNACPAHGRRPKITRPSHG